jgi:dihydrofolate reductase
MRMSGRRVEVIKLHVSMSLDGFVAGPDVSVDRAMGRGGEELHGWLFAQPRHPVDREVADAMHSTATVGAVLMGRRTFDVGIAHWGDDGAFAMPCVVVTHRAHDTIAKGPTSFTFVTSGLENAVARACAAAGDKAVSVMGADLARQLLSAGLIEELDIDLVPIILGGGTTLFGHLTPGVVRLQQLDVQPSATVTHIRYRVEYP